MSFIDTIRTTVSSLDSKSFIRYAVAGGLIFLTMIGGLIWWRSSLLSSLTEQLEGLYQQREQADKVLEKYRLVKKEQAEFDRLIAQDKNFNIIQYLQTVLKASQVQFTEPKLAEGPGTNTDLELRASTVISRTDMKTLVSILKKIEENKRVTIKALEINQASGSKIDVMLEIATLQKKIT